VILVRVLGSARLQMALIILCSVPSRPQDWGLNIFTTQSQQFDLCMKKTNEQVWKFGAWKKSLKRLAFLYNHNCTLLLRALYDLHSAMVAIGIGSDLAIRLLRPSTLRF
jgi:hypothetical protein